MELDVLDDDYDFDNGAIDTLPYTEEKLSPDGKLAAEGWIRMIPPRDGAFWRKGNVYLNSKHQEMPAPASLVETPYRGKDDGRKPKDETVIEPEAGSKKAVIGTVEIGSKQADRNEQFRRTDEGQNAGSVKSTAPLRPKKGGKAHQKPNGNG